MFAMWLEIGRMLSWSSMTTQFLHDASDRMNLKTAGENKINESFCLTAKRNAPNQVKA